ncbi:MAG: hypothetical protein R2734_04575 [Nocardioides sp.]
MPPAPAHAVDTECVSITADDTPVRATGRDVPLGLLGIPEAHRVVGVRSAPGTA